jgi:hypothetical protein
MKYLITILLFSSFVASAKMDLVTVPGRDAVQLTIYNSADLTLVKEQRMITLKKGKNILQFSWSNTLIDPTSLDMRPVKNGDKIFVNNMVFPPRTKELGIWTITSEISGQVPFEITYFTSRISWKAFYHGTLSKDETSMRLKAYVKVFNHSGEEYDNAVTRLIVGKINLKEMIAVLAKRKNPFGSPLNRSRIQYDLFSKNVDKTLGASAEDKEKDKQILKEGLSEYFLYTIEGKETIPNGWGKRLPSFDILDVPVINFYKYEEERFGRNAVRFLSFVNDTIKKRIPDMKTMAKACCQSMPMPCTTL